MLEKMGDLVASIAITKRLTKVQSLANKFERLYKEEKKKRQEAEGELTIIKGIGNNSPEMKALQAKNEKLKADLARVKEDHQYDNLVHQKELKDLQKK